MKMNSIYRGVLACLSLAISTVSQAAVPASQPTADWAAEPTADWPQLVLTNDATFDGHSPMRGASSFLVRMPDSEVVVGTAKHLIKSAGGVQPPVALAELDRVLTLWTVYPRTQPKNAVSAKGLAERSNGEGLHDWLLLDLTDPKAKLPAVPLVPRADAVKVGETVFLIGVPYSDKHSAQNIYKGVVTSRPEAHYFTYEFSPPVRIQGFSGAPIVDANGLLVGHGVSHTEQLKQKDGLEIEFGGEDASLALDLWRHRHDAPATRPADALHLKLPDDWTVKTPPSANILYYAEYRPLLTFVTLVAEPKANFSDDTDLMGWAKLVKANEAKASTLANRTESELKASTVAGRPTAEYEHTGDTKKLTLRYRVVMLECNGCFCKLTFWTTPARWEAMQPLVEQVVPLLN